MLHDLLIGLAFFAMVAAPAMVATLGGKKEYQPEPEPEPRVRTLEPEFAGKVIRPHSTRFVGSPEHVAGKPAPLPTLPLRARGMLNR